MKKIGLIDYGIGNLLSVQKAFEAVGGNIEFIKTAEEILQAEALILPGVGNFGDGIENLLKDNLANAIISKVQAGTPIIGICLGMQLLFDESEEAKDKKGLGIIAGKVKKFSECAEFKVPQIGWNNVEICGENELFKNIKSSDYFYFVHSFYCVPEDKNFIAGETEYGFKYCSAINYKNIFATQFHPEKSQDSGLQLLKNFVEFVNKRR